MKFRDMIFHKKRCEDGERILYLFGLRVFSYRKEKVKRVKEKVKHIAEYPVYIQKEYLRLKYEVKKLKNSK